MTIAFVCTNGHEFTAPLPPKNCPVCVNGKGCTGAVEPRRRK